MVKEGFHKVVIGEDGTDDGLHWVGYGGEVVESGEGTEKECVLGVEYSEAKSASAKVFA